MFCLTVQNPRSQNECSQHHKGFLDPESGILDPLGVICSKTEAWGSSILSLVGNRLSQLTGMYVREGVPDRVVRGAEPLALGPRSGKKWGF